MACGLRYQSLSDDVMQSLSERNLLLLAAQVCHKHSTNSVSSNGSYVSGGRGVCTCMYGTYSTRNLMLHQS